MCEWKTIVTSKQTIMTQTDKYKYYLRRCSNSDRLGNQLYESVTNSTKRKEGKDNSFDQNSSDSGLERNIPSTTPAYDAVGEVSIHSHTRGQGDLWHDSEKKMMSLARLFCTGNFLPATTTTMTRSTYRQIGSKSHRKASKHGRNGSRSNVFSLDTLQAGFVFGREEFCIWREPTGTARVSKDTRVDR